MQKTSVILTGTLFFGAVGISQASPLDPPDIVYIDGQPCNSACQSYMAWSRQVMPVPGQSSSVRRRAAVHRQPPRAVGRSAATIREAGSRPVVNDRIAKQAAPALAETPRAKVTDVQAEGKASAGSDPGRSQIENSVSTADTATHSATRATREQVAAAMAVAERLSAATSVAILMTRPDVRSLSDLAGKSIAIDNGQSASSGIQTAIVKAGAVAVQLTETQTRALKRLFDGEVAAAVLTLASPEAAEGFPEIAGFNIFRIPLTPEISRVKSKDSQQIAIAAAASDAARAKIEELRPSPDAAIGSDARTTRELVTAAMAVAEQMTAAGDPGRSGPKTNSPDRSDGSESAPSKEPDLRIAILMARPEIKSMSDLGGKEIAIDDKLSAPSGDLRTAMVAAGAVEVQLAESSTKAIDRVIVGEVAAAVLTLASPEAAEGFPEVAGFRIFRVPLSPR
jgi:TRAP-type uncharacterized transport system substrate-binding protein